MRLNTFLKRLPNILPAKFGHIKALNIRRSDNIEFVRIIKNEEYNTSITIGKSNYRRTSKLLVYDEKESE